MHGYHKKSDIGTHTYIAWTTSSVVCKSAILRYLAGSTLADVISVEARETYLPLLGPRYFILTKGAKLFINCLYNCSQKKREDYTSNSLFKCTYF